MRGKEPGSKRAGRRPKPELRSLGWQYAPGVVYVETVDSAGRTAIGSGFHLGEGIFVTARHVVEEKRGTVTGTVTIGVTDHWLVPDPKGEVTLHGSRKRYTRHDKGTWTPTGVHVASNDHADVALLVARDAAHLPVLPLGDHLDDWLGNEMLLHRVLLMGYPPIPFSREPRLVAASAEVNCIIDKYTGGHPHFIISSTARGGFSGGPVINEHDFVLGLVTESLGAVDDPPELGFMAVLTVEPIYVCMSEHDLVPEHIDKQWNGFWTDKRTDAERDAENIAAGWTITEGPGWKFYDPPPKRSAVARRPTKRKRPKPRTHS